MEHEHVGRADVVGRLGDFLRRQGMIRPGRHGNRVLAAIVHENQRHAGVVLRIAKHGVDADAFAAEAFDGLVAEDVAAHLGHQRDLSAEPSGGHGLVGPLAARGHDEPAAGDRFARRGQMRSFYNHVGVDAADNDDT